MSIDLLATILAVLTGVGMTAHFFLMASVPGSLRYPKILLALIVYNGTVGTILASSAFLGIMTKLEPLMASSGMILFALWLWVNGFHVCDFVNKGKIKVDTQFIGGARKTVVAILFVIVGFAGFVPAIQMLRQIETEYFPVNTDMTVTSVKVVGDDLYISGTITKRRDCTYVPPPRARDEKGSNLAVESRSPAVGSSWKSSDAPQTFGPWVIQGGANAKTLTFYQEQSCHIIA